MMPIHTDTAKILAITVAVISPLDFFSSSTFHIVSFLFAVTVVITEPDSDTEPDYDRSVNASALENGAELKANSGIKPKTGLESNSLFQKKETGEGVKWMAVKPWKGNSARPRCTHFAL
jgi:hypothetical protein